MVKSMTGFATIRGELDQWSWTWDMRSVNARGFDLRLRVPDWIEGLDQPLRAAVGKVVARGNVTLGLKLTKEAAQATDVLDTAALARVLDQMAQVEAAAKGAGVTLAQASAGDVMAMRGVLVGEVAEQDHSALAKALIADMPALVASFDEMRQTEGASLAEVLRAQLDRVAELTDEAADLAQARKSQVAQRLRENLARVLENSDGADETRVAQELAMLAVKADVTEEIDRLGSHIAAARDLLAGEAPCGRKLDFLMQEFNREANTLCSKAQSSELTRVGLDLKATIDQMREQVQNVE